MPVRTRVIGRARSIAGSELGSDRWEPRIIRAMGRKRIKKKEAVIPFRQTVAYHFMMVVAAFILFVIASIQIIRSIQLGSTPAIVISALLAGATGIFTVYNLKQMQSAKIPRKTAQRMRRNR